MFASRLVAASHGDTVISALSSVDSETVGRTVTRFDEFAAALLDALDAISYRPGPLRACAAIAAMTEPAAMTSSAHHDYTEL
jgi:hypothetical protein